MENLNVDNDVDSTSGTGSNEDVNNIIINKNSRRTNQATTIESTATKVSKKMYLIFLFIV